MITTSHNKPGISSVLTKPLHTFYDYLKVENTEDSPIKLKLKPEELLLLSATFNNFSNQKLLITKDSIRSSEIVANHLNHVASQQNANETWHLLSGHLSDHEISGDVSTDLSSAIHHLILENEGHHFVLPASLIDMTFPDPNKYKENTMALHVNEKVSLTILVRQLAKLGYLRVSSSIQSGTMRIQGDQIDIKHPTHTGFFTVNLHGSHIEKIEYHTETKNHLVKSLRLPPVSFPVLDKTISEFTNEMTVIQPAHLDLNSTATIIYDALHPDYVFPKIKLPKSFQMKQDIQEKPFSSSLITKLQEDKPAVHSDHGIGIFEGIKKRNINGTTKDYLVLRYAAGDTLSVPVEHSYKVSAYIGEATPVIQRLDSTQWKKARRAAEHNAVMFARDLLKTASAREDTSRSSYEISSILEAELNASFPYQLTPDQDSAWLDIQKDLSSKLPMDRLIIGDVGFGKTELAIRAARHAVNNGLQVAILAPTTLLVQQHYDTFINRLPDISDQIGLLSRFIKNKDSDIARRQMQDGQLKIIVGTHALLSKKVKWKNLGLVIIDEEQKFGVKHKEHFKTLRANLDIMSLSATPIPRTLSMSLSGLKQLSIISTPPVGRKSVETHVAQNNDMVIREAITLELKRKGQIYVVAPHVRKLATLAHNIQKDFPTARIEILHGKLLSHQIATIMQQFDNQEIDVLVSSTIIASGLDLPNANTIIVTQATHFGLADLYQLRGRIGRRERQGYAYFLYDQARMTDNQRQRLSALTEASRLSSGWTLAQRDLEIRGAGNLLGADQSGSVNAVGVQLYLDMVKDAVAKQKNNSVKRHDVNIHLPISAHIPTSYISKLSERTSYYQKLSRSKTVTELSNVQKNISHSFGPAPAELTNLYHLLRIQHLSSDAGITHIDSQEITPADEYPYYRITLTALNGDQLESPQRRHWRILNDKLVYEPSELSVKTLEEIITMLLRMSD
jgi:transcription-repair coupling factor (superfamily II helicase)